MPIPKSVASFNKKVTNRITRPLAPQLPRPVRPILGLIGVDEFLSMCIAPE
jgi:hypothetical protein